MRRELERRRYRNNALGALSVLVPFAFVVLVSFVIRPEDIEAGRLWLSPPCTYRVLFGHPCPTCGMTRAFAALSHGDLDAALRYNRAAPIAYGLVWLTTVASAALALHSALRWSRRRTGRGDRTSARPPSPADPLLLSETSP